MSNTTNLYRVVIAVLSNVNLVYEITKDGKLGLDDTPELFAMGQNVYEIAGAISAADAEFKALTKDELENLQLFVQDELDLPNDSIELIVESAINTALMLYGFFGKKAAA